MGGRFFGLVRSAVQRKNSTSTRNSGQWTVAGVLSVPGACTASKKSDRARPEPRPPILRTLCRKALKGRPTMLSSPQTASASLPAPGGNSSQSQRADDLAYQAVTVAAILLLLASLWVF